jgi:TetR/AcrR family transcriptional repressor of nem operon
MRKSKQETAKTRQRIVTSAAAEFRRHGINGIGLSDLMAASGLTHGGFYRHFDSKEKLVEEACSAAVESIAGTMASAISAKSKQSCLKTAAAQYLSKEHRDNPSEGCPFAALGSEIARCDESTRSAMTEGFLKLVDTIAGQLGESRPAVAKQRALVAVSTMIGALTVSRIVTDPELSAAILRHTQAHLSHAG